MKISIDTATDSPHAIRKAMDLLAYLANNTSPNHSLEQTKPVTASDLAQEQTQELSAGFSSMFGDDSQTTNAPAQSPSVSETPDTAPDFGSFLNLVNKTSNNNNHFDPKIEFF
jgi:hypothetical protein